MYNLWFLCLVVNVCRGTARRPRYKYFIAVRWKFCSIYILKEDCESVWPRAWLTLAHIQRRTPSNCKRIVHGCCLSRLPTVPLSAPGHRYSPIMYVHNTRAEGVNGNCIRQRAIAVSGVSWAAANRRRRVYMECDSNVGCITERDCHQTARCTTETAEHFESRRSAERSRSRRRQSGRKGWADGSSIDCRTSKCRNPRAVCRATVVAAWLPTTSATAAEVSCITNARITTEIKCFY